MSVWRVLEHSLFPDTRGPLLPLYQVMVLAELFLEMLQRDFGYRIYKMLLSLPEKVVAPPEPEKEEAAKEEEAGKEEVAKESKDEVQSEGTAAEADVPPVSISALHGTGATCGHVALSTRWAFSWHSSRSPP